MDDSRSENGGDFFDDNTVHGNPLENRFSFPDPFEGHFGIVKTFQEILPLLRTFFSDEPFGPHFGSLEQKQTSPDFFDKSESPRERMLKREDDMEEVQPQWLFERFSEMPPVYNRSLKDIDLDAEISTEGLEAALSKPTTDLQKPQVKSYSFFKSYSSTTVWTPDGKMEEKRTVRDSSGKQEKTIRRILGDQSHTVTTLQHPDGGQEVKEDLVNLEEESIANFNNKWHEQRDQPLALRPAPPTSDPSFMNIFRNFFGYGSNDN